MGAPIRYASGTAPTQTDSIWDLTAKILLASGGGGSGPTPPLGAAPEIYTGIWNDPNGNVTPNVPSQPARYSQLMSSGGGGEEWHWQPDTQQWGA